MPNEFEEAVQTARADRELRDKEAIAADDSLESAVQQVKTARQGRLKAAAFTASETTPDRHAKALQLAKAISVPVSTVLTDIDGTAKQIQKSPQRLAILQRTDPELATWLEDSNNFAISSDELPALSRVRKEVLALSPNVYRPETPELNTSLQKQASFIWKNISEYKTQKAREQIALTEAPGQESGGPALPVDQAQHIGSDFLNDLGDPQSEAQVLDQLRQMNRLPSLLPQEGMIRAGGRSLVSGTLRLMSGLLVEPSLMDKANAMDKAAADKFAPATFAESLSGGVFGTMPLVAGLAATRGRTSGALFNATRAGLSPQSLGHLSRAFVGIEIGGVSTLQNIQDPTQTPLEALVNGASEGIFTILGGKFEPFLGRGAKGQLAKNVFGEMLEEGATSGTQDVVSQTLGTGADDPYRLYQTLDSIGLGAAVGGILAGASGVPRYVGDRYSEQVDAANRAQSLADKLDSTIESLKNAKTTERDSDRMKELVDTVLGQSNRMLYVDAAKFRDSLQDPLAMATQLGVADQYSIALPAQTAIGIPASAFLVASAQSPELASLTKFVQETPQSPTADESAAFIADSKGAFGKLVNEAKAAITDAENATTEHDKQVASLASELQARLGAVSPEHIPREAIVEQANLVAGIFGTLAKRAGMTPQDLFNVQIKGEANRLLKGEKFDVVDSMIERLRTGDIPNDRIAFGDSLGDYLRTAGLKDDAFGGELKQFKEDDRGRKPGQKSLVRDDGISLDEALLRAKDRGYLPDGASINDLIDALDNEVRGGSPSFAEGRGDTKASDMRDALQQLADALEQAGITDLENVTNKQAREALAAFEEQAGVTLPQSANVVDAPRSGRLDLDALLKQWRKATGDRTPIGGIESWQQLVEQSEQAQRTLNQSEIIASVIEIDGKQRSTLNSNGKPIAQTEEAVRNFYKWFGDSKVVDDQGRPLVVYHKTSESFDTFKDGVTYFSENKDGWRGAKSIEAYLSIKDPTTYSGIKADPSPLVAAIEKRSDDNGAIAEMLRFLKSDSPDASFNFENKPGLVEELKSNGNDGYIADEGLRDKWFIAFSPDQIKSATANSGEFSAENSSILKQGERADIRFDRDKGLNRLYTVQLFKTADVSSFLHESGHLFLELLGDLAAAPNAPQDIVNDYQAVVKYLGGETGKTFTDEQHETFARSFEAYLLEGKAPTSTLRSAFARIKSWMLSVYSSIARLDVTLTPEIRGVFDRLVATQDAVNEAETISSMGQALDRSFFESDEDYDRYAKSIRDSTESSESEIIGELLEKYTKEGKEALAIYRDEIRTAVANEVNAQPVYQAISAMQRGELPDGTKLPDNIQGIKLDRADIVNSWNKQTLDRLPGPGKGKPNRGAYIYSNDNGISVEAASKLFGFTNGDAFLAELIAAPDRVSLIENETEKRMRAIRPDLFESGQLMERARQALATDQRVDLFMKELTALARKAGTEAPPKQILRQIAEDRIASMRAYMLAPHVFRVAAAKAAREAVAASAKQDFKAAFLAKQRELLNTELYRASQEAKEQSEKGRAYLRSFDTIAKRQQIGKAGGWEWAVLNADGQVIESYDSEEKARAAWQQAGPDATYQRSSGYTEQLNALMDGYSLKRPSTRNLKRKERFRQWLKKQQDENVDIDVPDHVIDDLGERHWNELTVAEQRAIVDTAKQIEHQARMKNKLLKAQLERELAAIREEITSTIKEHGGTPKPERLSEGIETKFADRVIGYFEAHRKDAFLTRKMDGFVDGGITWNYFVRPRNIAASEQEEMHAKEAAQLAKLFKEWKQAGKKVGTLAGGAIPGTNLQLRLEERIAIALNWGNFEGRNRVMYLLERGGFTASDAQAVLDSLDDTDWKLIDGISSQINSHWSDIAALELRVTGLAPDKVKALPFRAGGKVRKGGYYPIKYNPLKSTKAGDLEAAKTAKELARSAGARAQTRHGHTNIRASQVEGLALRLDLNVVGQHLAEVIHDLTHREMLMDQGKLLRDKDISNAIVLHHGRGALDQLVASASDIALGDAPARTQVERFLRSLRIHSSAAVFGYNLTSALINLTGITQSMNRVSPIRIASATARMFRDAAHMESSAQWVMSKSKTMKNRANTYLREVADATRGIGPGSGLSTMERWGYIPMTMVQRVVDTATWIAAYEQEIDAANKAGLSLEEAEKKAVDVADQIVVDTQGSGRLGDLAAVQRGGELSKLMTAFYSYFSVTANLQGESIGRLWRNPADPNNWLRLGTTTLLTWTIPAVMTMLIRSALTGDDRDEEEFIKDIARSQVSYGLGMLVGIREASGVIETGIGYQGPAGARGLSTIAGLAGQVAQFQADKTLLKSASSMVGILTGMPSVEVNRLIDAVEQWSEDGSYSDAIRRTAFGRRQQP